MAALPSRPDGLPAAAGIGLRAAHHDQVARELPAIAWLEVHSENFFVAGGSQLALLDHIRENYPLSLHGVGLALGSTTALDTRHLQQLAELARRVQPASVSEHLCWGAAQGRHANDLLPLPYTEEALAHCVARVTQVQDFLGRQLLIENVSSYLGFVQDVVPEWEFLAELARASGCGILLDVNNVYVSARNHGFDAERYISALPAAAIGEVHLAGHSVEHVAGVELRIDTHSTRVCTDVWSLYEFTLRQIGPRPTLIEWDRDIPVLAVLLDEAAQANAALRHVAAH